MNVCPNCNYQNPDDIHICLGCASSLKRSCPNCNAEVPINNRFCGQCGVRLGDNDRSPSDPSSPEEIKLQDRMLGDLRLKMPSLLVNKFVQASRELNGQRREVTVLIVEISDFSTISQKLDSETIYLAVDDIVRMLASLVYKYEGTIDKHTGSGLMALFGIPLNHENDPERAVRAALEMQQNMATLHDQFMDRYHHHFQLQIGINTGSVIASTLSDHQHLEYTIIGDTVQLASQLQKSAKAGEILTSFSTYQRSRPIFNFHSKPHLLLEGSLTPTKVFQPISLRSMPGQVRGLPGLNVPMIGRKEQLDTLIEILESVVTTNSSHIVLCSGDAGIGKSRLMAEFRNNLSQYPVNMVQGTCASYMRITPYRVVADVLRNLLGISELDPVENQRNTLHKRLEQLDLDRNDILPYLMHVLGLLQYDPIMEVRLKLLEPSMLCRQTHFALRMFFIAESRKSPLVLVYDDLHWVDQSSGEFLEYICQSLEDFPILLVMVARDFSAHGDAHSILSAASKHIQKPYNLRIQPLDESDANVLVDQLIHEDTASARELKRVITSRAGGNPYYTEELVRILMDHDGIMLQDGGWHVTEEATRLVQEVPGTLGDIILARFDHLPDLQKQILLRASVLGDAFSVRLLEACIEDGGNDFHSNLVELENRNFLLHTKLGFEDGYIFKHPLLQETIYKTILKRDLSKLHSNVAQAIESGDYWLPGERNQVLAHHFSKSTNPSNAIPYLLISAQNASQHFANETVIHLYRQALALMETNEKIQVLQKLEAQVGLAQALKFTSKLEEAARLLLGIVENVSRAQVNQPQSDPSLFLIQIDALRELADIRAREGDLDYAVQLLTQGIQLLGETGKNSYPLIWRRLTDRLAWVYFRQRNLDEAYNLVDLALMDTPSWETEDPITMASLYNTMGGIYWTRSRYADAIENVQHSLDIYKNLNYHWGMANALTNLGILNYSTGKWVQAVDYFEKADNLRRNYGDDPERPVNLKNLGEVLIDVGEYPDARIKLETSKAISQRLGLDIALADADFGLCRLAILEDRLADARLHLQDAMAIIDTFDEKNEREAHYFYLLAEIDIREGNLQKARQSADHALSIAKMSGITDKQSEALRVLGSIYAQMGHYEEAETSLYNSLELAQQINDQYNEGKAHYELGLLFLNWNETNPSQQLQLLKQSGEALHIAIRIFEALGAKYDLQRAKKVRAQLNALGEKARHPSKTAELDNQLNRMRAQLNLPDGEWYQATILSSYFMPRQGMDEELIFESIAFLIPLLTELITDNGGQIFHHQDGISAIFGAPIAHEDDPERAVETAMQIINFYSELNQQAELPISIHLGMDLGKIVAGKIRLEKLEEYMAAGEPVQFARQFAEACPSGRVWVSQAVRNQTAFRFEFALIPTNSVDNLPGRTIFQLEGLREQMLPVRGLIGLKSPFVGRNKELEAMNQMSNVLDGETGGIIWIEGEAGIGKSRLMREFSSQVVKRGASVLSGACTARRSEHAFSLFSDLLIQALDIQHDFSPNQINEQIDQKLKLWSTELLDFRPFLQLLLGVIPSGTPGERINAMEPEQLRQQTFVAIHRLFNILASKQPLVLILDDLQWIDSISADLFLYLSHLVVSQRILFVCAQRKKETSRYDEILARIRSMHSNHCLNLPIEPLTIDECRQLLSEFLSSADLPDSMLSLIVQQSGGNPYYIEEFVRLLIEKDYIRLVRGKLVANHTLQADALVVPASLESLIRARVDSLDTPARQLLQVASVLGHRFNRSVLEQVAEQDKVDVLLNLLHTRGMLNLIPEEGQWEFSHPLIEVIVYNTVLRAQRKILHHRTALVLEKQWSGNEAEHAEDLAYHFGKAESHDQALHYMILAGERAAIRHANDVAVTFYERAADLLTVVSNVDDESRWRIVRGMGEVYLFIGNYDASLAVLQSGLDLIQSTSLSPSQRAGIYRRMGDTAHKKADQELAINYLKLALEILGEPQDANDHIEAALILARLGWCHFMQSDLEKAKEAVMESRFHAGEANNISTLAVAENHLGGILYRQGDLQEAMQHTRTAMAYWQAIGYSWGVAAALSNLGVLESVAGNWQASFNSIKRSLSLRQQMGDVDGVAITNHNLGILVRNQGDAVEAELYFRDSLAVSRPFQMNWHAANSFVGLSQSLLYQGRIDHAIETLEQGMHLAQEINAPDIIVEAGCIKAEIHLAREEYSEAEESARSSAMLATQIAVDPLRATAWRLTAASLLHQGKIEETSKALQEAWHALQDSPDRLEEGRLHAQSVLVELATNNVEKVRVHRAAAEQTFKQLGALRDLAKLEAIEVQ